MTDKTLFPVEKIDSVWYRVFTDANPHAPNLVSLGDGSLPGASPGPGPGPGPTASIDISTPPGTPVVNSVLLPDDSWDIRGLRELVKYVVNDLKADTVVTRSPKGKELHTREWEEAD